MGIRVSHEPAAGLLAAPAYGAGLGQFRQRQAEIQRQQFNIDRQRQDALRAQEDERQRRDAALALEAQDRAAQNQYRTQQQAMSMFGQQVEAQQRQQQLEQGAEFDQQKLIQQGLKDGTLKYTTAQRQQIAKLQGEWDRVNATKSLRPRDRELALQEISGQLQSIQPRPVMESDRPQTMDDIIAQRVRQLDPSDKNSPTLILDKEGEISKVIQPRNVGAGKSDPFSPDGQTPPTPGQTHKTESGDEWEYDLNGKWVKRVDAQKQAEEVRKQEEAKAKEQKAAEQKLLAEARTEAKPLADATIKSLEAEGVKISIGDRDRIWTDTIKHVISRKRAEMAGDEVPVGEDGLPLPPQESPELQLPEGIRKQLARKQNEATQQELIDTTQERYNALKKQIDDSVKLRMSGRDKPDGTAKPQAAYIFGGKKGEFSPTQLPPYTTHEKAVADLKKFGITIGGMEAATVNEQPDEASPPQEWQGLPFRNDGAQGQGQVPAQQSPVQAALEPTTLNRALVAQLKAAGFPTIKAALESGNPQIVAIAQQLAQQAGE